MRPAHMCDPVIFLRLSLEQAVENGDAQDVQRLSDMIDHEMIRLNEHAETEEREDAG